MDAVERYERVKSDLERLKSEAERRRGAEDVLMGKLKDEYGCKTIDAAERLIAKLEATLKAETSKLDRLINEMEEAVRGKA